MPRFSNWREDIWLSEVVTGKMTDKEALKKVDEKKGIHNKVIINPKLTEAIKEIGGEVIDIVEADTEKQHQIIQKKQMRLDRKKLRLRRKDLQQAQQEKNAGQKPEETTTTKQADVIATEEVGVSSSARMKEAQKEAELKAKEEAAIKKAKKVKEEFEDVVEYFYEEGINEEGIDLLVEEIGLEEFVDFVDGGAVELNEERAARKMNVRTLKATKKKAEEIKSDKSDVVKKGTPADTLARARTERAFKKPKLAKPAPKKEAPKPVAKKVEKAVKKVKPAQPKKEVSKDGIRAKVKSAYEAGVKRHRKATQPIRVFHKGMKKAPKAVAKAAVDVKRAIAPRKEKVKEEVVLEKDLNAAERRALPDKEFALPGKGKGPEGKQAGSYPIPDKSHARMALAMVAKHGTSEKKAKVRAAVAKKFPGIQQEDYETKKKGEVLKALDKKKFVKKYGKEKAPDIMYAVAAKTAKKKGDTSKSDDRYAYEEVQQEAIERQAKDRKKLSQPHSVSGSRRDHSHDVDSALTDHVPRKGKGRIRPASKKEMRTSAMRDAGVQQEGLVGAKVDSQKEVNKATRKAAFRPFANTKPPKLKVAEDRAFDNVVSKLRAKYGKDGVITKDSPKPKPQPRPKAKPQKPLTADEKAQREVDARYGRTPWNKKGSLGT